MTTYFAIRHKPTGKFLPRSTGRNNRGFTNVSIDDNNLPRLFFKKQHAQSALTWWLRGVTSVSYYASSWESGIEDTEDWQTKPVPSRKAEDMEVVEVRIEVVSQ